MNEVAPRSILLAGATGLIGGLCLQRLLDDPGFGRIVVLTRHPLAERWRAHPRAARLEQHVVDFDRLSDYTDLLRVDEILCALGTTIKKAGSQERFRVVDHDYPLQLARLGLAVGAQHFLLVSALGANPDSGVFYNRVKGQLEEDILSLAYRSITVVRPSLLLGERSEFRLAEEIGKHLAFLVPGKYKPVEACDVAAVLVDEARSNRPGVHIIDSPMIRKRAAGLSGSGR